MYIKFNGNKAEVYEQGVKLKKADAINLVEKHLGLATEEKAIDVLSDALIMLEKEREYLC